LGWQQEAKDFYQQMILLAEAENNLSEVAAGWVGLAHLAVIGGNFSEARGFLEKAQEVYQLMGNSQQFDLIQSWLVELEKKSKK